MGGEVRSARIKQRRRGSAMVTVIILTSVMAIVAGAALTITVSSVGEVEGEYGELQALYMAEAGVNAAIAEFTRVSTVGGEIPERLGAPDDSGRRPVTRPG